MNLLYYSLLSRQDAIHLQTNLDQADSKRQSKLAHRLVLVF